MKQSVAMVVVLFAFIMGVPNKAFSGHYDRSHYAADYEIVVINRPVNIQGLTGLLFTNSAYTQPAGSFTFGLSAIGEDSDVPDYSIVQGGGTVTIGITDRIEVGIKGKMIATNLGSTTTREVGTGDTDLLLKWRFSSQGEIMPALAFGLGWTIPSDSEKGFSEVKYEGIKLMVIATGENRVLDDGFIGVYLEGQAVFIDQLHKTGQSPYKEKYGVINAGLLFPISDDNRVQFLLEYNAVVKKDIITLQDGNYNGVTAGLRFVTENFNISLGMQHLNRETSTPSPAVAAEINRLLGTISYRF